MIPWSERDMIIETNRDVKWIRAAIAEIKEKENELDMRIRILEENRSGFSGLPLKESQLSAGLGAGAVSVETFTCIFRAY